MSGGDRTADDPAAPSRSGVVEVVEEPVGDRVAQRIFLVADDGGQRTDFGILAETRTTTSGRYQLILSFVEERDTWWILVITRSPVRIQPVGWRAKDRTACWDFFGSADDDQVDQTLATADALVNTN